MKLSLLEAFIDNNLLAQLEEIWVSLDANPNSKKVLNDLKKLSKEMGIPMKNVNDVQKVLYMLKSQDIY